MFTIDRSRVFSRRRWRRLGCDWCFCAWALGCLWAVPVSAAAETHDEQFAALQKRYKAAQEEVWAKAEKAKDQEDRLGIFRESDPANTMIIDFLQLEEQCRGTQLGL